MIQRLVEVPRIDEAGRPVRTPQSLIELEAPIDVAALLRPDEGLDGIETRAAEALQVLEGGPAERQSVCALRLVVGQLLLQRMTTKKLPFANGGSWPAAGGHERLLHGSETRKASAEHRTALERAEGRLRVGSDPSSRGAAVVRSNWGNVCRVAWHWPPPPPPSMSAVPRFRPMVAVSRARTTGSKGAKTVMSEGGRDRPHSLLSGQSLSDAIPLTLSREAQHVPSCLVLAGVDAAAPVAAHLHSIISGQWRA